MKQHFLPQTYLKEFCNSENKLHTLNLEYLKYGKKVSDKTRHPVEICNITDFYTIDDNFKGYKDFDDMEPYYIEKQFHSYENEYSKNLEKVKSKQPFLTFSEAFLFIYSLVDIKIRNPYFRNVIEKRKSNVVNPLLDKVSKEIKNCDLLNFQNLQADQLEIIIERKRKEILDNAAYSKQAHLSAIIGKSHPYGDVELGIVSQLIRYEWIILQSDKKFITTDNPGFCLDENNVSHNTKFAGNVFFFIPITPSLCLGINTQYPDYDFITASGSKGLLFSDAPEELIEKINSEQTRFLNKHIFASEKMLIDEMASRINSNKG